jgi:hypothetical protein
MTTSCAALHSRTCAAAALISGALSLAGSASAVSPEDVRLRVAHVNAWAAGYDAVRHTYREEGIETVLTDPDRRPVLASICRSLPEVSIRQQHVSDGPCPSVRARVAPEGVSAFVWTLRGRHPLLDKDMVLETVRQELQPLPRTGHALPLIGEGSRATSARRCFWPRRRRKPTFPRLMRSASKCSAVVRYWRRSLKTCPYHVKHRSL